MDELINVQVKDDKQLVDARELYRGLQIAQRFNRWVESNFGMFVEGVDYSGCTLRTPYNVNSPEGEQQEISDYIITLDMAKSLAMMVRNDNGKKYRNYFLDLEKKWNDPQEVVKRGYAILQNENTQLKLENKRLMPKAVFADSVASSSTDILIGELAKILSQNGIDIGQNRLFRWLRRNEYLGRHGGNYNVPTQKAMRLGVFRIKETTITHSSGKTTIQRTAKVTGKGQTYFVKKFLDAQSGVLII